MKGAPRQDLRLAAPAVFGNSHIVAECKKNVKHYFIKNNGQSLKVFSITWLENFRPGNVMEMTGYFYCYCGLFARRDLDVRFAQIAKSEFSEISDILPVDTTAGVPVWILFLTESFPPGSFPGKL